MANQKLKKILHVIVAIILISFFCVNSDARQEVTEKKSPIAVRIAINNAIGYDFRGEKHKEHLPLISGRSFCIVIINVSKESIKIPRFSNSYLTLKLINDKGKEYLLSASGGKGFGSTLRRAYDADVLNPYGCLVYCVNMSVYEFPKTLFGRKIKLQAIYRAPEIVKNLTRRKLSVPNDNSAKRRTIELTKNLKLWHGEVSSPLREFIFRWDGTNPKDRLPSN